MALFLVCDEGDVELERRRSERGLIVSVRCALTLIISLGFGVGGGGCEAPQERAEDEPLRVSIVEDESGEGGLRERRSLAFGYLRMFEYVPPDIPQGAPLVVVLHGCLQAPIDFLAVGWSALASRWGFALLYPEQTLGAGCFTWFDPLQTSRGWGEVAVIREMVRQMIEERALDPSRVYVTGLSAGAGMASALLSAYPDVFSAGALMAGPAAVCASNIVEGYACMSGGSVLSEASLSGEELAARTRERARGVDLPPPRVSIWQGSQDEVVNPDNAHLHWRQWVTLHGFEGDEGERDLVEGGERWRLYGERGEVLVERWLLSDLDHAVAVDPRRGCGWEGPFVRDVGRCAAEEAARFFELEPREEPPKAPDESSGGASVLWPRPTLPLGSLPSMSSLERPSQLSLTPGVFEAEGFGCEEFTSTHARHIIEGRAELSWGYVWAKGSREFIGVWSAWRETTLRRVGPERYEVGVCP